MKWVVAFPILLLCTYFSVTMLMDYPSSCRKNEYSINPSAIQASIDTLEQMCAERDTMKPVSRITNANYRQIAEKYNLSHGEAKDISSIQDKLAEARYKISEEEWDVLTRYAKRVKNAE